MPRNAESPLKKTYVSLKKEGAVFYASSKKALGRMFKLRGFVKGLKSVRKVRVRRALRRVLRSKSFRRLGVWAFTAVFILSGLLSNPNIALAAPCATGNDVTIAVSCDWAAGTHIYTGTLTINAGVTVQAIGNTTTGTGVTVIADNYVINGTIEADSNGYPGGTSTSDDGDGPGGGDSSTGFAFGASHGGRGSSNNSKGEYGSIYAPILLGSGGGDDGEVSTPGTGGGAFKLFLNGSGTMVFGNGAVLTADGGNASAADSGGGAGGSIWIDAPNGTVTIAATHTASIGAIGGRTAAANGGGAGGGGRIAMDAGTCTNCNNITFDARGGAQGEQSGSLPEGGAGSIFLKLNGAASGDLIYDNNNFVGSEETSLVASSTNIVGNLIVRDGADLWIPNTFRMELASGGTLTGGGTTQPRMVIFSGGTFDSSSSTFYVNDVDILQRGSFDGSANLVLQALTYTVDTDTAVFPNQGDGRLDDLTLETGAIYSTESTGAFYVENLTAKSGSTVQHGNNTTAQNFALNISATSTIDIRSGATVDVDALGYSAVNGPCRGTLGSQSSGGGGGHGGSGGSGSNAAATGGLACDSVSDPIQIGSGGESDEEGTGGAGGGLVRFTTPTTGSITINGTVTADGASVVTAGSDDSGGGAGGAVYLSTGTLIGSGTVGAIGGSADNDNGGGGGGGGRIAVYFDVDSSSITYAAQGGDEGNQSNFIGVDGGAGTIYRKDNQDAFATLVVSNGSGNTSADTPQLTSSETYKNITIAGGAVYEIGNGETLTLDTGGTLTTGGASQSELEILSGGTFDAPTASFTFNDIDVEHRGTIGTVTDMTIQAATYYAFPETLAFSAGPGNRLLDLTLASGGTYDQRNAAGRFYVEDFLAQSGSVVTHGDNATTVSYRVDISATNTIDIQPGATVDVDGLGFDADAGTGAGVTSANVGSGGAHGGNGGSGGDGTLGGTAYGSVSAPLTLGSGGGDEEGGGTQSTPGGGSVRLTAGTTLTLGGTITADGLNVNDVSGLDAGAGAGGSVYLTAATFSGNGSITANGGSADNDEGGGGGGGGRIALHYDTDGSTWTKQARGGDEGNQTNFVGQDGGAGTIYLKDNQDTFATLIVENGSGNTSADTPQLTSSETYKNITIAGGAVYDVGSGETLTLDTGGTLTGGGTNQATLQISSGGTYNPSSTTLTVDDIDVTVNGTFATTTNLTVKNGNFTSHNAFAAGLAALTIDSAGTYTSSSSTTLSVSGGITVKSGGLMTHTANTTTHVSSLNLNATNLDIQTGGSVSVNGRGFAATSGPGEGADNITTGGGAGHGGAGGSGSTVGAGGGTYGSISEPVTLGSGGGNDSTNSTVIEGGPGGGVIKITLSGTLTLNGTLSADGTAGTGTTGDIGGGGAGGSIWYDVTTAVLNADITADGGNGGGTGTAGGGGGGGGRIAAYYVALTGSGTSTVAGGAKGGTGAATAGASGSTFNQVNPPVVTVTAPNGGQTFEGLSDASITFTHAGTTIDHFRISLSTNGGSTFGTVITSSATSSPYAWTVTNTGTTQGRIKVEGLTAGDAVVAEDVSDADFTITAVSQGGGTPPPPPTPSVFLTAPNGGQTFSAGQPTSILWNSSNVSSISLAYSLNGGSSYTTIATGISSNTSFYNWTVPSLSATSTQSLIRVTGDAVSDTSDAFFTIEADPALATQPTPPSLTITSPNGGETVVSGGTKAISWTKTGIVGSLSLSYSLDGGSTYSQIVSGHPASSTSYAWTTPAVSATSTQALVRITDGSVSDTSDGVFTVTPPPELTTEEQETLDELGLQEPPITVEPSTRADEIVFSFSQEAQTELPDELFAVRDEASGLYVNPATDTGTVDLPPSGTTATTVIGRILAAARGFLAGLFGAKEAHAQTEPLKYSFDDAPFYLTAEQWGSDVVVTNVEGGKTYVLNVIQKPADPNDPATLAWSASATTPAGRVLFDVSKKIIETAFDDNPDPDAVTSGATLTYQFTLENVGNLRARNVTLVDPFPAGTTYVAGSLTSDGARQTDAKDAIDVAYIANAGREARWVWYALEIGDFHVVTVKLRVSATAGQSFENAGLVTGNGSITPAKPAPIRTTVAAAPVVCGDNRCEVARGETYLTCRNDCPATCGDDRCQATYGETRTSCAADCAAVCGDDRCEASLGETWRSCQLDCPTVCGNSLCQAPYETTDSCAADCPASICGNRICQAGESYTSCPSDCPAPDVAVCGDRSCQFPETSSSCPLDCPRPVCGDSRCVFGESATSCPLDCRALGESEESWQLRITNFLLINPSLDPDQTPAGPEDPTSPGPDGTPADTTDDGQASIVEPPRAEFAGYDVSASVVVVLEGMSEELGAAAAAAIDGLSSEAAEVVVAMLDALPEDVALALAPVIGGVAAASEAISDAADAAGAALVRDEESLKETPVLDALRNFSESMPESISNVTTPIVEAAQGGVVYVRTDPTVQTANRAIVTPAAAVSVVASNSIAIGGVAGFQQFGFFLVTQAFFLASRRKRQAYGTVYSWGSKLPVDLAAVRLVDAKSDRVLRTRVTDKHGRYIVIAPPGEFKLEVQAKGFTFPSPTIVRTSSDGNYSDLYFGDPMPLPEGRVISKNIPIDPTGDVRSNEKILADTRRKKLQWFIAFLGLGIAVASYLTTPYPGQILAFFVHAVVFFIFYRLTRPKKPKSWGTVRDEKNKPLAHVVVRIVETGYNKVLESQMTDAQGRYSFLVGSNAYYLRFEKPGYAPQESAQLDFRAIKEPSVVALDVTMKAPQAAPTTSTPTSTSTPPPIQTEPPADAASSAAKEQPK